MVAKTYPVEWSVDESGVGEAVSKRVDATEGDDKDETDNEK